MRMTNTAPLIQAPNWWALEHPLWMCAMRPFFVLTMGSAVLLVALWSAVLALGLPPPRVAGGYIRCLRPMLIRVSQITESLSVAFRCRRPSTAPATVNASASASVM